MASLQMSKFEALTISFSAVAFVVSIAAVVFSSLQWWAARRSARAAELGLGLAETALEREWQPSVHLRLLPNGGLKLTNLGRSAVLWENVLLRNPTTGKEHQVRLDLPVLTGDAQGCNIESGIQMVAQTYAGPLEISLGIVADLNYRSVTQTFELTIVETSIKEIKDELSPSTVSLVLREVATRRV